MSNDTTEFSNPTGFCLCGCGQRTRIARQNHAKHGWVKGEPLRYINRHHKRKPDPGATTNARGYTLIQHRRDGRILCVPEHRLVWEAANGPIPEGWEIHHIDGDKGNNSLGNLVALSSRHHKRLHHGWKLVDGEWMKPCNTCCEIKPTSEFYPQRTGHNEFSTQCKECSSHNGKSWRRARKAQGGVNGCK